MNDEEMANQEGAEEVVQFEVEAEEAETETPEEAESTEGQDDQPAEPEGEDEKPLTRNQRRKIAAQKARDELDRLKRENEALQAALQETSAEIPRPKDTDFDTEAEYTAALAVYLMQQQSGQREGARIKKDQERINAQYEEAQQRAAREVHEQWEARRREAVEAFPDFDAVVTTNERLPVTMAMKDYLATQSDRAAEVAYFLGQNPDRAAVIAAMPEQSQHAAMALLEGILPAQKARAARTSTAPDPIQPVRASGGVTINPEKAPIDDYAKWREAGGTF
jgi:hypothetical protein